MIAALWGRAQAWMAAVGVIFGIVVAAFFYGRFDGKDAAREEQARAVAKARIKSKEVENEINGLDDLAVRDRLGGWMRDGKR